MSEIVQNSPSFDAVSSTTTAKTAASNAAAEKRHMATNLSSASSGSVEILVSSNDKEKSNVVSQQQSLTTPPSPGKLDQLMPQRQNQNQNGNQPRKLSHQPQSVQADSPPRRKFSQQQRQHSLQQSHEHHQFQSQHQPQQFQPSWRKGNQPYRQSSLGGPPTFRLFHVQDHQAFTGPWPPQSQPQHQHPHGRPFQRRGSSHSVTFQPHQEHQQRGVQRKMSHQHQMTRKDSADHPPQQQQTQDDRRRNSSTGKGRKKSDGGPNGPNSGRSGRMSFAGPRWSSLSETMENGDYEYYSDEFEMEEPFSDSDDETPEAREARHKRLAKPLLLLPMPRRRIRTLSGMIPAVGYAPVWGGPTMCLNCLEFFDLPKQTSEYVQHLLDKHKIVVTDIELIVDLKRYVEHWRHRFGQEPIEKVFPKVTPDEKDSLFGKVDNYYLMSEKVLEDRQIRERLALRRLEEVLSCQQREREDQSFHRQCLFCRYRTKGNRAKLIHHLYTIHHLNLGSPDNLVFVSEYLDVLEGKLKRNECIYCEKTFPDHPTLSEHMRKKQHREVNPKNNYYDRFYVINYLELGKKWLEVLAEDFEDTMPTFADSDEEEEEESWNEWQEDAEDDGEMTAVCLFCEDAFEEAQPLLNHMKEIHHYDLKQVFADGRFGFYDRVKLINYIRKLSNQLVCFICGADDLHSWPALRKHLADPEHMASPLEQSKWDKDEYLVPIYDNDNLLCLLEDILELNEDEDFTIRIENGSTTRAAGDVPISGVHETIVEDNEEVDKEENAPDLILTKSEEVFAIDKDENGKESENGPSCGMVVIPEDLPILEEDSPLNDPELREQLK